MTGFQRLPGQEGMEGHPSPRSVHCCQRHVKSLEGVWLKFTHEGEESVDGTYLAVTKKSNPRDLMVLRLVLLMLTPLASVSLVTSALPQNLYLSRCPRQCPWHSWKQCSAFFFASLTTAGPMYTHVSRVWRVPKVRHCVGGIPHHIPAWFNPQTMSSLVLCNAGRG